MKKCKILIIVPAYNEGGNIGNTLAGLKAFKIDFDVVVVDDGSSDDSGFQAKKAGVRVLTLPFNLGIGGAVQTGLLYAKLKGYDFVAQFDADGQHDASCLEELLRPVMQGQCDMVIGSRFLTPYLGYRSSFIRRVGIHFFSMLISFLTGVRITDPTSGFRAFNKKAIAVFSEIYPVDFPEPESIVIAKQHGLVMREVPVKMHSRHSGHSSIRYLKTLYYMIKVTLAIFLDMVKTKKVS